MRHMASSNLFMFYSAVGEPIVVFAGMQLLLLLSTAAAAATVMLLLMLLHVLAYKAPTDYIRICFFQNQESFSENIFCRAMSSS